MICGSALFRMIPTALPRTTWQKLCSKYLMNFLQKVHVFIKLNERLLTMLNTVNSHIDRRTLTTDITGLDINWNWLAKITLTSAVTVTENVPYVIVILTKKYTQ